MIKYWIFILIHFKFKIINSTIIFYYVLNLITYLIKSNHYFEFGVWICLSSLWLQKRKAEVVIGHG